MRTVSSSVMTALVVIALFWGNCFSCPQVLLSMKVHEPAHQCCHHKKAAAFDCSIQNLQHFVKADLGTAAPTVAITEEVSQPAAPVLWSETKLLLAQYSPPVLLTLQSSLRI